MTEAVRYRRTPTVRNAERDLGEPATFAVPEPAVNILEFQALAGNRAVSRLLAGPPEGSQGEPLSAKLRADMERRFATDLSDIRIHRDPAAHDAADEQDAQAYTIGSDIVFGNRQWDPATSQGFWLLGHEVAHAIQQRHGGGTPDELQTGCLEQDADAAADALLRLESDGELPSFANGAAAQTIGPATQTARPNVAGRAATIPVKGSAGRYVARQPKSEAAGNQAAQPGRPLHIYRKSPCPNGTSRGHFDEVVYNTETEILTVTVRPTFHFPPFQASAYPAEIQNDPGALSNAEQQFERTKQELIGSFVLQAEAWGGHHVFYCHEPPLVGRRASVRVEVDLTYAKQFPSSASISTTSVTIVDDRQQRPGTKHGSMVVEMNEGVEWHYDAANNVMVPQRVGPPFETEPLPGEGYSKPGGLPGLVDPRRPKAPTGQLTFTHELGHVFGLGDEYVENGNAGYARGQPTDHSELAATMLRATVRHGDDNDTVMAQGMKILPQHGVTFLAALRSLTGLRWEFDPPS